MSRRNRILAAPMVRRRSASVASWLALVLLTLGAAADDKLVLQLHREPQFEFAGYYAALWKGFYREAGLEIEIKAGAPPGAAPINPVREVIEKRAQFGTGTAQLLIRAAQGSALLLLAPIFQRSGTALYYRADGDFSSPRALLSGKVGRFPTSNILDLELRTVLHSAAVDPDKLKSVPIELGQSISALADHRVDAVVGSAWELPWQAQERGIALKSFPFAGYRPEFYGDSVFTLQRFANADPSTAERFRAASIKGWEYALQHPDEIVARIVGELPAQVPVSDPAGFARYQSEIARRLARFPATAIGQSDPARWSENQQSLTAIGAISRPVDLETFLYDPDDEGKKLIRRIGLVLVSAAAIGFLVTAGLFWRRRSHSAASAEISNLGRSREHIGARLRAAALEGRDRAWKIARQLAASTSGFLRRRPVLSSEVRKRVAPLLDRNRPHTLVRPRLARWRDTAFEQWDLAREVARRLVASTAGARPGPRPAELNAALTAVERSIRRRLPGTVECRLSLQSGPWLCRADPDAVATMVLDLVEEAVTDMRSGGELVVGTRQSVIDVAAAGEFPGSVPGEYVRVTVKDNGCGLSAERLQSIFYPEKTPRPAVAAAWELTRRLGGFAAVESAEGVGTAVHLYFVRVGGTRESAVEPVANTTPAEAAE
jgi:ABC-type nitrate/sulfonate/bicarbonate transport system substrate-binding protein/signal transduction histidine kinase